jgi:hypothetical protein
VDTNQDTSEDGQDDKFASRADEEGDVRQAVSSEHIKLVVGFLTVETMNVLEHANQLAGPQSRPTQSRQSSISLRSPSIPASLLLVPGKLQSRRSKRIGSRSNQRYIARFRSAICGETHVSHTEYEIAIARADFSGD